MPLTPIRSIIAVTTLLFAGSLGADVLIEAPEAGDDLLANVRAHLSLNNEACDAPPWRVRRRFRRVEQELRPALRAFGYYHAEVSKTLTRDEDCWQVKLVLTLGPPVRVRQLDLQISGEAADDPEFQALSQTLPLQAGEILHHGHYEAIKSRLHNLALERGYFDAELSRHELRVDPAANSADILLSFASGPRYRFGELQLSEQPLHETFVLRLADLEPGSPYDARRLAQLDRNLSDAGYFQQVEVRLQRDRIEDQAVPVSVTLEPLPRHAWRAGVGFATDTGPRLSLGYDNRYINRRGHRFDSEMTLSPVESGLTANYMIPGRDPHRESFTFSAGLLHEDTDSSQSDSFQLNGRRTRARDGWTETRMLGLLHERSLIGDERTEATLLMPGISWSRSRFDDLLRTRHGYRLNLELRGAYEGLLSTTTLLQLRANAKGVHRFGEGGRITARTDLGATLGGHFFDLPASLRFFAGGDNSVRGYDYESLGPRNADGDAIGGRNLLVSSLEYEHPVVGEDWWAAAFIDAGNAFDSSEIELEYGYGLGVRWYLPIGRLRLDLAFPSDTREDSWRLHFGFGADL